MLVYHLQSGMILRFAKLRLLEHLEVERIASCVEWSWCGAQVQNVHVSGWELHTGYIHCGGTNSENDGQINSWFVPNSLPNMFCLSQGDCKIGYYFGLFWHVLACFSTFWCCQCNFCCLLLIFIFRQFLTYVWFFLLLPNLSLRSFFNDKIAHICGAVAFIPGGLLSSCAAMHAAFPRLLHASAFSLLPLCKDTTKGSTMCTANKNKPACSDPWRSDSQACSVTKALQQRSLEMRTWQYVDDYSPSPSYSCRRRRLKAHKAPL